MNCRGTNLQEEHEFAGWRRQGGKATNSGRRRAPAGGVSVAPAARGSGCMQHPSGCMQPRPSCGCVSGRSHAQRGAVGGDVDGGSARRQAHARGEDKAVGADRQGAERARGSAGRAHAEVVCRAGCVGDAQHEGQRPEPAGTGRAVVAGVTTQLPAMSALTLTGVASDGPSRLPAACRRGAGCAVVGRRLRWAHAPHAAGAAAAAAARPKRAGGGCWEPARVGGRQSGRQADLEATGAGPRLPRSTVAPSVPTLCLGHTPAPPHCPAAPAMP